MSSLGFNRRLTVDGTTFTLLSNDSASAPASDSSHIVVLGSDQHMQLLAQRIQELSTRLLHPSLSAQEYDSTTNEIATHSKELKFVRDHHSSFIQAAPNHQSDFLDTVPFAADQEVAREPLADDGVTTTNKGETRLLSTTAGGDSQPGEQIHITASKFGELAKFQAIHLDHGNTKLFLGPRVRQYITPQRVLHRAPEHDHVGWQELFQDLIYVGALAKVGYALHHDMSWTGLGQFTLLYLPLFFNWVMCTIYNNRYGNQDMFHKILTVLHMFVVCGLAVNSANAFDSDPSINTSTLFLTTVVTGMLITYAASVIAFINNSHLRPAILAAMVIRVPELALYLATALATPSSPTSTTRIVLWSCAIGLGALNSFVAGFANRFVLRHGYNALGLSIEHIVERYGLFVIVALGELAVGILYVQSMAIGGKPALAAALGLLIAFGLQFVYFRVEAATHKLHALRRSFYCGVSWTSLHVPLTWSIVALASCIANLVAQEVKTATPQQTEVADHLTAAGPEGLTIALAAGGPSSSSDAHVLSVASFHHWLFWASLAVAFSVMGFLGRLHVHNAWDSSKQRFPPIMLMSLRFGFAILFIAVGFVGQALHFTPLAELTVAAILVAVASLIEELGRLAPPQSKSATVSQGKAPKAELGEVDDVSE